MSISSILALFGALGIFISSLVLTTHNYMIYINPASLVLVLGGSMAAAILSFRLQNLFFLAKVILRVLTKGPRDDKLYAEKILQFATDYLSNSSASENPRKYLEDPFFSEGLELLKEDFKAEEIKDILTERLSRMEDRQSADSEVIRTIAKYPPAFGMLGTLVGLIAMLQSMGGQGDFNTLGPSMAVALITTFYGIFIAYMFIIPLGEVLAKDTYNEIRRREMILEAVYQIKKGTHPVKLQQIMYNYLPPRKRENFLKTG